MKTSSAKGKKEESLQKWVVEQLVEHLGANPEDIESRPMGSSGEDVIMGVQTRELFHIQSNVRIKRKSMYGPHTNSQQRTVVSMNL